MKTAEEYGQKALADISSHFRYGLPSGEREVIVKAIVDAIRDYHALRLKEALRGGGPVGEARLAKIRKAVEVKKENWNVWQSTHPLDGEMPVDLLAALDHALAQNLALDGQICDLLADGAALVEEGARREREEVRKALHPGFLKAADALCDDANTSDPAPSEGAAYTWQDLREVRRRGENVGRVDVYNTVMKHLASRGPLPDPLPGDLARARVGELEDRNEGLKEVLIDFYDQVRGSEPSEGLLMHKVPARVVAAAYNRMVNLKEKGLLPGHPSPRQEAES